MWRLGVTMRFPLRTLRAIVLGLAALPLLTTGPCLTIANQSAINGFFNAVTPLLVDAARNALGLTPTGTTGTSTAN
jgi:hypothetical protein